MMSKGFSVHFLKEEVQMKKMIILWRSILLSTMRKTLYPYYAYVSMWDMGLVDDMVEKLCNNHKDTLLP